MTRIDVKVVLLGKGYGGKTSLVERYFNNRFIEQPKDKYQTTIGAAYASRTIEIDGRQIDLGVWDTAGSEKYEAMSKLYYRNAKAAIVCFDLSDMQSFEKARYWVKELQKHEDQCKIYLCGTKCDLVAQEPERSDVKWKMIRNYAELINAPFFETSSKTDFGIDDLFSCIARDNVFFKMEQEIPSKIKRIHQKAFLSNKCFPCYC